MQKEKHNNPHHNGALSLQNYHYRNTGGISQNNNELKFIPAFYDPASKTIYISCYTDGKPAPVHILDGLPDDILKNRIITDEKNHHHNSLIVGFIFKQKFLSRQQAADLLAK